ncbi:MAG: ArnT family glycosyltransferase [Candidatus Sumerlaeaceae bacterium]
MTTEQSPDHSKTLSGEDAFTRTLRAIVLAWMWLLILYFLAREGLVRFQGLIAYWPSLANYIPQFLIGDPDQPGSYPFIIRSLFTGPYRIWWENVPWLALLASFVMIVFYVFLGWLVLDWFEDCMAALPRAAVALVIGCGIVGVTFELVTLAGWLYQPVVIGVWIALFAVAWGVRQWRRARPDPIYPHEDGQFVRDRRRGNALAYFKRNTISSANQTEALYQLAIWFLIGVTSFLIFCHAIALPETYWDSLILYIGYARMIFLQHSFPVKICGQVGIGLGSNYPHLYPLLTAQTATLMGGWQDTYAQVLPAVAGIATVVLVYATVLEFTRDRLLAASCALLFRAIPYGIAYFQYASDYAVAILFTAAFLYAAAKLIVSGSLSGLALTWLIPAFAVHINYLMWVLWPVACLATFLAHTRGGSCERAVNSLTPPRPRLSVDDDWEDDWSATGEIDLTPYDQRAWEELNAAERLRFSKLVRSPRFLVVLAVAVLVASPWYVRNIVLTGNPVYAFFYNVFPSKNVNPAVMKSAEVEWRLNGDGLGRVGSTLTEKIANSWYYFVSGPLHWRLGPVFMALCVPGFMIFAGQTAFRAFRKGRSSSEADDEEDLHILLDDWTKFSFVAALLFVLLWFYAYCVADMYLYQIIIVLPLFAIFAARVFELCPTMGTRRQLYLASIIIGLAPGVLMAAMGFKLKSSGTLGTQTYSQVGLTALRNLFIDRDLFYRMEFDGDMLMLRQINSLAPGTLVLTHENRHLLIEPQIRIVHLDDWLVQRAYHKPPEERMRVLDSLGIKYYLYVPNEDKHRANSWLGMDELIGLGYFRETFRSDASGSSWRDGLDYRNIPPDKNVLYRRTSKQVSQSSRG